MFVFFCRIFKFREKGYKSGGKNWRAINLCFGRECSSIKSYINKISYSSTWTISTWDDIRLRCFQESPLFITFQGNFYISPRKEEKPEIAFAQAFLLRQGSRWHNQRRHFNQFLTLKQQKQRFTQINQTSSLYMTSHYTSSSDTTLMHKSAL